MKARFNYTGRRKILRSSFKLEVREQPSGSSKLHVSLNKDAFDDLKPGLTAKVEAYRASKMMIFILKEAETGKTNIFDLDKFEPTEPINFRIKLVDSQDPQKPIKAWADRISPVIFDSSGKQIKSILHLRAKDLGPIAWRIDWEDYRKPVLEVNSRINESRSVEHLVKHDPSFALMVLPQVLSEILNCLILIHNVDDEDEINHWLKFADELVGTPIPGDRGIRRNDDSSEADDVREWIETVVRKFSEESELLTRYTRET